MRATVSPADAAPIGHHPSPRTPGLVLPARACDAHVHVFGPAARFAFAPNRPFTPPEAPKEALFALHARLGIARCVVVQSTCHGFDNAVTEDALAAAGGRYCGVALLPACVADAELRRLDRAGFRGVRFNFMAHLGGASSTDELLALGERIAPLGWHLQVHCEPGLLAGLAPALRRARVPVVIDHMGRVDASAGLAQPAFETLCGLLADDRFLVKVSGAERASREAPPWEDALPFARHLVERFPDQVLWGTDWPHPNLASGPPDDGLLVDLLTRIAPGEALRARLLVDNPQRLYRFDADRGAR